uniref:TSA: Wollemia nobilis Ref_Wollemi_Transcript_14340_2384 transcribed RNA sequence n=1 Tax=Wollemia nobilis TaxID=56998 RepID=A0A0C9S6T3_9CONI
MGEEGYEPKYASGGVVEKHGNPADRSKTGGWSAAAIILGAELSERICVVGIVSNLVTYLVGVLHLSNADAANIVTNLMGTLYLLCLLGGFVADSFLGRFKTIAIFGIIQTLGIALLAFSTSLPSLQPPPCTNNHTFCIPASPKTMGLVYASLYITALGVGGVKSNVSGFGSDQFDNEDPKEQRKMVYFFNRFYFCVSIGSLFAVTVLVYVQDYVGRGWGYGIPAGSMVMALAFFLGGLYLYRYRKPAGSPITQIGQVLVAAWRNRNKSLPPDPSLLNQDEHADAMKRRILHTNQFRCLDKAAVVDPAMDQASKHSSPWKISTIGKVEEVKMVVRLLPIWSTCIMLWTVYSQGITFSVVQANTMDRTTGSFKIPSASIQVFLVSSVMFFATFSEKCLVPFMRRITGNVQGITSLQRVAVGLVLPIFTMLAAALVEKKRLDVAQEHGLTQKFGATVPLSVYWLVPQYFLVGAGEAFAYVGLLEFFITESPVSMKSMSTGLFLSTISLGFYLSSLLVTLVNKITRHGKNEGWLPNNLNRGRLDYFYWLLLVLSVINLFVFFLFARSYKYKGEWASSQEDHNSCDLKDFNSALEKTKTEDLEVYVDV